MPQTIATIKIEIDRETDLALKTWANSEGKSKRRHLAILARKLTQLKKSHPLDLSRLGLSDQLPHNSN